MLKLNVWVGEDAPAVSAKLSIQLFSLSPPVRPEIAKRQFACGAQLATVAETLIGVPVASYETFTSPALLTVIETGTNVLRETGAATSASITLSYLIPTPIRSGRPLS